MVKQQVFGLTIGLHMALWWILLVYQVNGICVWLKWLAISVGLILKWEFGYSKELLALGSASFSHKGPDSFTLGVGSEPPVTCSTKSSWNNWMPLEEKKSWTLVVGFKCAVPKHVLTFWVANLNMLTLRSRLESWGMERPLPCCLCNSEVKTRDYLLLHCIFSKYIGHKILHHLGQYPCIFMGMSTLITFLLSKSPSISTTLNGIAA